MRAEWMILALATGCGGAFYNAGEPTQQATAAPPAPIGVRADMPQINALGKCLQARDASNGSPVEIADCDGSTRQAWSMSLDGELHNGLGKCLSVPETWDTGTFLIMWDCFPAFPRQAFLVYRPWVPPQSIQILGKCVDVDPNGMVVLWDCVQGAPGQAWYMARPTWPVIGPPTAATGGGLTLLSSYEDTSWITAPQLSPDRTMLLFDVRSWDGRTGRVESINPATGQQHMLLTPT